jgi:hypothetical protein
VRRNRKSTACYGFVRSDRLFSTCRNRTDPNITQNPDRVGFGQGFENGVTCMEQDNQNASALDAQDQPQDPGQPDPALTTVEPTVETVREPAQPLMGLVALLKQYKTAFGAASLRDKAKLTLPDPDSVDLAISTALAWEATVKGGKVAQHEPTCHSLPANQPAESQEILVARATEPLNALPDNVPGINKAKLIEDATADIARLFVCDCALSRKGKGGNRANPDNPGAKKVALTGPAGETATADSMSDAIQNYLIKWYPDSERLQKYMEYMQAKKAANARVFIMAAIEKKQIPAEAVSVQDPAEAAATEPTA